MKIVNLYIAFLFMCTVCLAQEEPIRLGDVINSSYAERVPLISLDGKVLYFARKVHPQNMGENDKDDIWISYLDEDSQTWTKAVNVGSPLNNDEHNFVVSVNTSADAMYLANDYNTNVKDAISYTTRMGRKWAQPKRLDIPDYKNKSPFVSYHVSKDEKYLLIAAEQNKTVGGRDFYVSFKTKNGWSSPLNLGEDINSKDEENSIFLAADNKTVYFSSNGRQGQGGYDLYMSRRLDESWTKWSTPKNLGNQINTHLDDLSISIPASGDYVYLARGPIENTDIFKAKLPQALKPEPVTFIQAQLVDAVTQKNVNGRIYFESLSDQSEESKNTKGKQANYIVQQNEDLGIYAQVPGYLPTSDFYAFQEERYESVDGDNEVYYQNTEVQILQDKLDDLQRELKKLTDKKEYNSKRKNNKKEVKSRKNSANKKTKTFKDVNEKEEELSSLQSKYEQHFQEETEPLRKEEIEAKESDSDALKASREKYAQYYGGGESANENSKSKKPSSLEIKSFSRSVEKALYTEYYLSIVREVKKSENIHLSNKDIAGLESKVKADLSQYWISRLLEELESKHNNKLKKEIKEQLKRDMKEEFASVVRTEITIIIKQQKEKDIETNINKQLAEKPKKKSNYQKNSKSENKELAFQQVDKQLQLVPIAKGAILRLNNIFFDINEASLKPQSNLELKRIFNFMKENPQLQMEISGHTNGWCSPEFAAALSEDRAASIYQHLIDKGISEDKLTYKGYGKSDPIASNTTVAGRKQNQRVELKIIDIIE